MMTKDFHMTRFLHHNRILYNTVRYKGVPKCFISFLCKQLQLTFLHILLSYNTQHLIKGWHYQSYCSLPFLAKCNDDKGPLVNWYLCFWGKVKCWYLFSIIVSVPPHHFCSFVRVIFVLWNYHNLQTCFERILWMFDTNNGVMECSIRIIFSQ